MSSTTILFVDDNDAIRAAIPHILRLRGYEVLVAASGDDALAIEEKHAGSIDLLITDLAMPEMSGIELRDNLLKKRPKTRVLFMTGYSNPFELENSGIQKGDEMLQKPSSIEDLLKKIREILE